MQSIEGIEIYFRIAGEDRCSVPFVNAMKTTGSSGELRDLSRWNCVRYRMADMRRLKVRDASSSALCQIDPVSCFNPVSPASKHSDCKILKGLHTFHYVGR